MHAGVASCSTGRTTSPSIPCSTEPARLMTSNEVAIGRGALDSFSLPPFLWSQYLTLSFPFLVVVLFEVHR